MGRVEHVYTRVVSLASFVKETQEFRGDHSVRVGPWQPAKGGYMRDVFFMTPSRRHNRFSRGPDTKCFQTQLLTAHVGRHVVFEIAQQMDGFMMSDTFQVLMRWEFLPASEADVAIATASLDSTSASHATPQPPLYHVKCRMSVQIPFTKPVPGFMMAIIRSTTKAELESNFEMQMERLTEKLAAGQ